MVEPFPLVHHLFFLSFTGVDVKPDGKLAPVFMDRLEVPYSIQHPGH